MEPWRFVIAGIFGVIGYLTGWDNQKNHPEDASPWATGAALAILAYIGTYIPTYLR